MDIHNTLIEDQDYILSRYKNVLKKQGITTVYELLSEYPIRYDDYTVSSIEKAELDQNIVLEGSITSKITVSYLKAKLTAISFLMDVEGKTIKAIVFNRLYLKNKLDYGMVIRVQGKFYKNMNNFTIADLIIVDEMNRDIVPIYKNKDISEGKYLEIIEKTFRRFGNYLTETIPNKYLMKEKLISFYDCVKILHFPENFTDITKARYRLKYQELLKYQLSMKYLHMMREKSGNSPIINYDENLLKKLYDSLPYELTADQKKVINDILGDLQKNYPMNRLLQGEVGSGKTIVALAAILATVSGGFQAALMCPTEILSLQHFQTISSLFSIFPNIKVALLTGSTKSQARKEIIEGLKNKTIDVVVGTHALFQKDIDYNALALVIADEEHRFGVRQRVLIRNKGLDVNYLKMSATPIPRTLSISAYGDMDISIIKEMPKNRQKVITKYVDASEKRLVVDHMKKEIKNGHQIYVVTPLINESETLDTANATEIYANMVKYFKGIASVGLIHGRLKADEKEKVMDDFLNKKIDILVATSLIEVGVNVLNATTIVILGAERFGLATLHQLRGRVMRSSNVPYCFLISEKKTESSEQRLKLLETTSDGFKLAEYDLISRGPGEFFGEKQSGSMNFKFADLKTDAALLEIANKDAEEIIKDEAFFKSEEYRDLYENAVHNYEMKQQQVD